MLNPAWCCGQFVLLPRPEARLFENSYRSRTFSLTRVKLQGFEHCLCVTLLLGKPQYSATTARPVLTCRWSSCVSTTHGVQIWCWRPNSSIYHAAIGLQCHALVNNGIIEILQRLPLVTAYKLGKHTYPIHLSDLWKLSNWSDTDGGNDYNSLVHGGYSIWLLFHLCLETIFSNSTDCVSWKMSQRADVDG